MLRKFVVNKSTKRILREASFLQRKVLSVNCNVDKLPVKSIPGPDTLVSECRSPSSARHSPTWPSRSESTSTTSTSSGRRGWTTSLIDFTEFRFLCAVRNAGSCHFNLKFALFPILELLTTTRSFYQ